MSRLPIRLRLTLVFALALTALLFAVGAFVYFRVGASIEEQLDESLAARGELLAETARRPDVPPALQGDEDEFAQMISRDGAVLAATPGFERVPLLSSRERALSAAKGLVVERNNARHVALAINGGNRWIIVGGSLEDRDETLAGLLTQLLVGGAISLVLSLLAAYLLAGAALRPVESMRRSAAEISADTSGRRLPMPATRDEIARLGATLNAMLDRLDAGLRRERRFVADAGHELRTPLALLQTELELALHRPRAPEDLEQALRSAADEVDRLTRLAEDLLTLASVEEGRLRLRCSTFSVDDLLGGVARRFSSRADAAGRSLEVVMRTDGTMTADRIRLEQALGNLVDNALRHGAGAIRLEAVAENGSLELRVTDEGRGFPPEFAARAFDRFSRADAARARGGAGLGLAIVDAIARAHGGSAHADGAAVSVVVPRA